jgi:hypothetical protein
VVVVVLLATLFRLVFCCICIDPPPSSPVAVETLLLTSRTSGRLDSAAAMGRCDKGGHAAVAVADNTVIVSCVVLGNTSDGNPSRTSR